MSSNRQDSLNLISKKWPRIFVGFDLDFTIFNPSQDGVSWIGGKQYWLDLIAEIKKCAEDNNVEFILGFITKKGEVDDIVQEAAQAFCELLKNQNPYMIKRYDDQDYVLVNVNNKLSYDIISASYTLQKKVDIDPEAFTSIEVIAKGSKLIAFDCILSAYGISSEFAMMVDDTPEVIAEFKQRGTRTVSFKCFHNYPFEPYKNMQRHQQLEDINYIEHHLSILRSELINKVKELISKAKHAHEKNQHSRLPLLSQAVFANTKIALINGYAPAPSLATINSTNLPVPPVFDEESKKSTASSKSDSLRQDKSQTLRFGTLFNSHLRNKKYFVNEEPKTFTEGLVDYFRCILT